MDAFLQFLKDWGQLINFGLYAGVIGMLFKFVQQYRANLEAKHKLDLAGKDNTISSLTNQLNEKSQQLDEERKRAEDEKALWKLGLEKMEAIGTLPPEERLRAIDDYRLELAGIVNEQSIVQHSDGIKLIHNLIGAAQSAYRIWIDRDMAEKVLLEAETMAEKVLLEAETTTIDADKAEGSSAGESSEDATSASTSTSNHTG